MLFAAALVAMAGCSTSGNGSRSTSIDVELLTQHWVHSREEEVQSSPIEIFRPADYTDFPPSRFRMQYVFEDDGTCQWFFLAPNDAHHFRDGSWRLEENGVLQIEQGEESVRYQILELTPDLLRMSRVDS